jgi:nucleoside-diphosphate-sugar epimerase
MATVLIAGCGYVGTALGRLLHLNGDVVFGLRRDISGLPSFVRPLRADIAILSSCQVIPEEVDDVVYTVSADAFSPESYRRAYVEGLVSLLSVLENQVGRKPRRLVYVSSTSVYGQTGGELVDETSPTESSHFAGRTVLEGERRALGSSIPSVVVRFGGIYGPERTRLIDQIRQGTRCVSMPVRYMNRIHRDDCAGVLAHLLRLESPRSVYLGVDDAPAPRCEVMRWLAGQLGASLDECVDATPIQSNKRCSNRRLRTSGYQFVYPTYRDGYRAILG